MGQWCCCCCIIVTVLVLLGSTLGFVLYQFSPHRPLSYQVTDAALTHFKLSTDKNNTLDYNLVVNITIDNPNNWSNFHYEQFDAVASYNNQDLSNFTFNPFSVGHKDYDALQALFKGQIPAVALAGDEVSKFPNATDFDIVLKFYMKYWTKFLSKAELQTRMAECHLKVPLSSNGQSADKFESTNCKKV